MPHEPQAVHVAERAVLRKWKGAADRQGSGPKARPHNRFERIFITVLTALCGLMMGYTVPLYLKLDWRWRLLALPATVLLGWFTWARYSRGHEPSVAFDLRPLWVAPPSRARSLCELRASCLPQIPCSRPKRPLRAEWREAVATDEIILRNRSTFLRETMLRIEGGRRY